MRCRRNKIIGLIAKKPISDRVTTAIEALFNISKRQNTNIQRVPDSILKYLIKQLSIYVDKLPGSVRDMADFRRDLITMMIRRGPPTLCLTLSAPDSAWVEPYMDIVPSAGIQEIRQMNAKQR